MRTTTVSTATPNVGSRWKAGLAAGGAAAVVNVLLYGLAKALGLTFLAYIGPGGELMPIPYSW